MIRINKRPDTTETVLFALELLRRIPRHRKVTARELQSQLAAAGMVRDIRTIQRQLELLSAHFQIERDDRSKPYGYRWLEQAQVLAVPTLTPSESLLLQLAEEHLRPLLPAHLMQSMGGFFTQARRNLSPDSNATLERQWHQKIRVVATSQPLLPPQLADGVFAIVSEALYRNHWLDLYYSNAAGKRAQIQVMPLGLAQQGPRLYLVCRYRGYNNERNLALHRILAAEMSTLSFTRPRDFDLARYDADGRFGFGDGKRVQLSFTIEKDAGFHLTETPLSADQEITALDNGRLRVSASVANSAMLEWWLRGFGDAVTDVRRQPLAAHDDDPGQHQEEKTPE